MSNPCAIRHIDIRTVKKEDLSFKVPFELKATRNDCEYDLVILSSTFTSTSASDRTLGATDVPISSQQGLASPSTGPRKTNLPAPFPPRFPRQS